MNDLTDLIKNNEAQLVKSILEYDESSGYSSFFHPSCSHAGKTSEVSKTSEVFPIL